MDRSAHNNNPYEFNNRMSRGRRIEPEPDYPLNSYNNYQLNPVNRSEQAYVNPNLSISNINLDNNGKNERSNVAINIPDSERRDESQSDFISIIANDVINTIKKHIIVIKILLFIIYNVYLGFAIHLTWDQTHSWCNGVKLLVIMTGFAYFMVFYYIVLKPFIILPLYIHSFKPLLTSNSNARRRSKRYLPIIVWLILIASAAAFVIYDSISSKEKIRMLSAAGLIGLLFLGFLFSKHRTRIIWTQVLWGVSLQFVFGLIILRWSFGKSVFECLGDKVSTFLGYTNNGTSFVFGYLISGELNSAGLNFSLPVQQGILAFKVLPTITFFSFFVSILYYYGIMQSLVLQVGWFLQKTVGTTACESLNASSNIFLGMSEAPLVIKPFISIMTKSELHAVMTGGFATIAGSVMAAYMSFGVSATHLLSASVMSAPAALAYSKLIYPETEESKTTAKNIVLPKSTERNAIEAASNGASASIKLVANVAVNLIAFIAFIAFLDSLISWFGSLVKREDINFRLILSKIFIPLALGMGVRWEECDKVARLVGLKTIINEFVAYQELGSMIKSHEISKRAEIIATYALCGFSNLGSIGIQLGVLGGMSPERKSDLATMAFRAMVAGSAACFMTACIAGMLITSVVEDDYHNISNTTTPLPNGH